MFLIAGIISLAAVTILYYQLIGKLGSSSWIVQVQIYLVRVWHTSRQNASQTEKPGIVIQLDNYSRKVQSWYEETSTNAISEEDSGDEELDGKGNIKLFGRPPEKCKGTRTTATQTHGQSQFQRVWPKYQNSNSTRWEKLKEEPVPEHNYYSNYNNWCDPNTIRNLQQEQLKLLLKQVRYLGQRDMKAPLIICVEANSSNISGYLLNLRARTCKFYVFGTQRLPWDHDTQKGDKDTTEFKMKNLLFALLLWEREILALKKFSVFVNCWAINHPDSDYGKIVTDFLEHFTSCENVIRVNSNSKVSFKDANTYARLMQPARDLMTWNLSSFRRYIRNAYGILDTDFQGSHSFLDCYHQDAKDDGYFAKTFRYNYYLDKVNRNADKWCNRGCPKCGLKLSKSMMLKNDLRMDFKGSSETIPFPLTDNFW